MKSRRHALLLLAFWLAGPLLFPSAAHSNALEAGVDAAIVFAVDASGSIDPAIADLQMMGHVDALRSAEVVSAIRGGALGCIAITYVEWSSVGTLRTVVPWTRLCGRSDAEAAADLIERGGEQSFGTHAPHGRTSLSFALDMSSLLLDQFRAPAARKIIDISANGSNNDGLPLAESHRRTIAKGHVVNGIVLSSSEPGVEPDLAGYFSRNVIGGPGSFLFLPARASDYAAALRRKLVLEISGLAPSATDEAFDRSEACPAGTPAQSASLTAGGACPVLPI